MQVIETDIPIVKHVVPTRSGDKRGWFSETYQADVLARSGIHDLFNQHNGSLSAAKGTVHGLHF